MSQEPELDMKLVGRLVERVVKRYPGGKPAFIEEVKISRPSIDRAAKGDISFDSDVLPRIEEGAKLPDEIFAYTALHDWDSLKAIGVNAGLIRWLKGGGVDAIPSKKRTRTA